MTRPITPTGSGPRPRSAKRKPLELGIDLDQATRWIEGLDRIHKTRRIRRCFDLTATPFAPTGKKSTEKGLFEWIISDFGLNDAIEAGLVKTPRIVVRDDALANAKTFKPKLYHLYNEAEVREDLGRSKAEPHESLPDLVQKAYALLAYDWRKHAEEWAQNGNDVPPVMLTVCNRIETAARIEHYFNSGDCPFPEPRYRKERSGSIPRYWKRPSGGIDHQRQGLRGTAGTDHPCFGDAHGQAG